MQFEHTFSQLIYEFFIMRFHFQYYKFGDTFPTVETLCQEFDVSSKTVQYALKRLRNEGYISTQDRGTKVIFQQSKKECDEYTKQFILERYYTLPDLFESTSLILLPFLVEGLYRMDEKDFTYLWELSEQLEIGAFSQFYYWILKKMNNSLLINLFLEIVQFEGLPFLYENGEPRNPDSEQARKSLKVILVCGQQKNKEQIQKAFLDFHKDNKRRIMKRLYQCSPNKNVKAEQIPFIWRVYRERPQVCYNLAMCLLNQILMGEYQNNEFLPSYKKMSEKFEIPVITIRRTVGLLNKLGVVQLVNGIGVRILHENADKNKPDLTDSAIQRNLIYFFQAFEIVLYSGKEVAYITFTNLTHAEKKELIDKLQQYLNTGKCDHSLWECLLCIGHYCPLIAAREIYRKIYSLFLWGHPLKLVYGDTAKYIQENVIFTETIIENLKNENFEQCSKTIKKLIQIELPVIEKRLLNIGLKPEELRNTPAIKLLLYSKEK